MTYQSVFTALSDPTRREIFEMLAKQPSPVQLLADRLPVSRPAVSQHLKVLSDAGLVTVRAMGTRRIYAASPKALEELRGWLDRLWGDVLGAFSEAAEKEKKIEH